MIRMIKNKCGDIPVTILVLGIFVICSLALLSFFISNAKVGKSFAEIDLMEKMDSKINEYHFYQSKKVSDNQIKKILAEEDFYIEGNDFLINKSKTSFKFAWSFDRDDWLKDELLFSCEYSNR